MIRPLVSVLLGIPYSDFTLVPRNIPRDAPAHLALGSIWETVRLERCRLAIQVAYLEKSLHQKPRFDLMRRVNHYDR